MRQALRHLGRSLAGLLAPPVCVLCGGPGQQAGELWGLDLCMHCEAACPRGEPEDLPFGSAFCLFRYEEPVDQMITGLKFSKDLACARVLGTLFARAYRASNRALPDCIVPVPLHRQRYRERGFDQSREIARHIARRLHHSNSRPLAVRQDLLHRMRVTAAQSHLAATERAANLRGAFHASPQADPPRHVALLDDVLTTGHTAAAAATALQAAGVARVELWCCARALRRHG